MTISVSWLSSSIGFSISRPLTIVSMMTITAMSIAISMTISITWLSSCGSFSISRSLAIVSMVTISTIAMSISMTVTVAISRLSNSHTQEGQRDSNQNIHVYCCSFSTTPM